MDNFLSREDDIDVTTKVIEKLLRQVPDEPLKHVEEITLPEPLSRTSRTTYRKQASGQRGPKPPDSWYREIRKAWGVLDDVDKLGRSWLASLPEVQELATSEYEGGLIGRGKALKELLTQALIEARQYETDEKTHMMLSKYPEVKINVIAKECGISREQFSRNYVSKATTILTETFQRTIGRKTKSRAHGRAARISTE